MNFLLSPVALCVHRTILHHRSIPVQALVREWADQVDWADAVVAVAGLESGGLDRVASIAALKSA